jgi:hypothetical protein
MNIEINSDSDKSEELEVRHVDLDF